MMGSLPQEKAFHPSKQAAERLDKCQAEQGHKWEVSA